MEKPWKETREESRGKWLKDKCLGKMPKEISKRIPGEINKKIPGSVTEPTPKML